ncbi:MAG: hypothetical protein IKD74_01540 [Clostridia bacterium]|nr:hypothetical protein [Clostridia bacterium]
MEEIECLKYLYINLSMQRKTIKNILSRYELKDSLYYLLLDNLKVYSRFMISIKYMLKNRINKDNFSIKNNVVDTICSIQEQVFKSEGKQEIKKYIKEASKINILDIKRARKEYKIKSKTIQNLLDRMVKFELSNLENIKNV